MIDEKPPPPPEGGTWESVVARVFILFRKAEMNMKENMFYGAGNLIFEKAKKLRNNVTPTEMILWARLKEYFPTVKFGRQHPVLF